MGDRSPPHDASFDLDFIDEFLGAKDSQEIPGCYTVLDPNASSSLNPLGPFDSSEIPLLVENGEVSYLLEALENQNQDGVERFDFSLDPSIQIEREEGEEEGIILHDVDDQDIISVEDAVLIGKSGIPSPKGLVCELVTTDDLVPSIKERLTYAMMHVKESQREGGVLVQVWVPIKKGAQHVLTTFGQPFWLDHHIQRLVNYREISTNYLFSAVKNSREALGLPGRVFVEKVPEWTPDVRFFSSDEYPRVNHAQHYDVRGSVAVPLFERGGNLCLGVLEMVMINEKVNYDLDLENISNALQAVDLRSSDVASRRQIQVRNDLYHIALPEISEVLRVVCQKHKLPLAQTWIPCIEQGRSGSRHSDQNYCDCVSTVDTACCIPDASVWGFHKACSEHHLFVGQGLVGFAFTTNQPCFSPDLTALSKTRYPLSHHARIFNLRGAVAIRLRSNLTGTTDFVLEFFLPSDCITSEMQKSMLESVSATIQESCRTLRVVTEKELADQKTHLVSSKVSPEELHRKEMLGERQLSSCEVPSAGYVQMLGNPGQESSQVVTEYSEGVQKDKGLPIPSKQLNFEEYDTLRPGVLQWGDTEILSVEDPLSDFISTQEDLADAVYFNVDSISCELGLDSDKNISKKKRGKAEKVISLQLLQRHFAGSLKDAAKSLGVCQTTLKRICRRHGITRWPSRKIKKFGNSLQKLQKVISSVQGVEGSSELNALYSKLSNSDLIVQTAKETTGLSIATPSNQLTPSVRQDGFENIESGESNPSSSSSHGCSASHCNSSSSKGQLEAIHIEVKGNAAVDDCGTSNMKKTPSGMELNQLPIHPESSETNTKSKMVLVPRSDHGVDLIRVKAVCGDDMVRLKLQPTWGLDDLKLEIAKRFNISNMDSINLKYLDDDSERVLLTCDADLLECLDVHMASSLHTVKISVHCHDAKRT